MPRAILVLDGAMAIETNVACVTVRVVVPVTPQRVAEIVVKPTPEDDANPFDPVALLMEATVRLDEFHTTWLLKS